MTFATDTFTVYSIDNNLASSTPYTITITGTCDTYTAQTTLTYTFLDACDSLTPGTPSSTTVTYTIGVDSTTKVTYSPGFSTTGTSSGCTLSYSLVYNDSPTTTVDSSIFTITTSASGYKELSITTTDPTKATTYYLDMVATTALYSKTMTATTVRVTIEDLCAGVTISGNTDQSFTRDTS